MKKKYKIRGELFVKKLGNDLKEHQNYLDSCILEIEENYEVVDFDFNIYRHDINTYSVMVTIKYKKEVKN